MSYEAWKETYEKILKMDSELEKLYKSPELLKCWKYQWENLNNEYLLRFREELLNSIQKENC